MTDTSAAPAPSPEDQFRAAAADHRAGRLAEAEAGYRALIAAQPDLLVAHQNLVALLRAQARVDDLAPAYRALLALAPSDEIHHALALNLLRIGRYAEAWPHFEHRAIKASSAPRGAIPEWQGEALEGKSILVWQEQGLGDQIQMARYIPLLQARGARAQYACSPSLQHLFDPFCETVLREGEVRGRWDYWVSSMSLPYRFGTTLETIPPPLAIAARPGGAGVGVITQGNPGYEFDAHRSLRDPELAARVLAIPGAVNLDPAATGARDFADTAQIIAGLRCVVTTDTAVAHLAASMGKPTFILLSALWVDWRWMLGREDSPWYPAARLVRQPHPGDWTGAIDLVRRRLEASED